MARNKTCAYCGASNPRLTYRRLPNKLFACVECHREKNPLWMASAVNALTKADKSKMVFRNKEEEKRFDEAVKAAKDAPPLHHIEANPMIRQAYKLLLRGRRVKVGSGVVAK